MSVGDNLSSYPNLEFLESSDALELKNQMDQIRLPYKIISIYALGGRHYAWVSLTRPIQKVLVNEEKGKSVKKKKPKK